ncbi:MAG: hypothetical protein ACRDTG_30840 [Pseudonocardiaceae bacterium]
MTALEILQRFNDELVQRFTVHGPRALRQLRQAEATTLVPWPASGLVVTLRESLRIASKS